MSYGNQGSGIGLFQYNNASPWENNIIRYNISINDGNVSDAKAGIYIWNQSPSNNLKNCAIYNNTIYNNKNAALSYSTITNNENIVFYNNILVGNKEIILGKDSVSKYYGNTIRFPCPYTHRAIANAGHIPTIIGSSTIRNFCIGTLADDNAAPAMVVFICWVARIVFCPAITDVNIPAIRL